MAGDKLPDEYNDELSLLILPEMYTGLIE